MKNIIMFILVFVASSCSIVPKSPLDLLSSKNTNMSIEEMNKAYPFWNMKLSPFRVDNLNAGTSSAGGSESTDPEMNRNARILNIRSKEVMLERLNIIRFVVNTPEFANLLRTRTFRSSRNAGSVKLGDILDNERLVKVLQKASFSSQIRKTKVVRGAIAHANLGAFLYLASDETLNNSSFRGWYVAFANTESWEGYNTLYIAGVLFHELLHNMGFNHLTSDDATNGIERVFLETYEDPKWQRKYKQQLISYQYYTKKYANFLQEDSLANQSRQFNGTDLFTADQTRSEDSYTRNNEIEEICIFYLDGTYKLVKMQNGRII